MDTPGTRILTRLAPPAYLLAAVLLVGSPVEALSGAGPIHLTEVNWRYNAEVLLSGYLLTMTMGALLASAVTIGLRRVGSLRSLAVLFLLIGGILLPLLADFALNALQVRRRTPLSGTTAFELAAARSIWHFVVASILLLWLGILSNGEARRLKAEAPESETGKPYTLLST